MHAGGFLLLMALYGTVYAFPALSTVMAEELGSSRAVLQGAFAAWSLVVAACAPLCGRLVDWRGARPGLVGGSLAVVGALAMMAWAREPWQVYLALVGLGAPGHALSLMAVMVTAGRAEVGRRGLALGLAGTGIGAGLTILLPAAIWLSTQIGWRGTWGALAILVALVCLPAVFGAARPAAPVRSRQAGQSVWALFASPTFLVLFAGGIGIGVFDEAMYQHLIPHLVSAGWPPERAALLLGIVSLGYLVGQMGGGWFSDRRGRWPTAAVAAGLGVLGLSGFAATASSIALLGAAAMAAGLGLGATVAIRNVTVADLFQGRSLGTIVGAYYWAYALGAAIVAWAGAAVFEGAGTYSPVFLAGALCALLWALCLRGSLWLHRRAARLDDSVGLPQAIYSTTEATAGPSSSAEPLPRPDQSDLAARSLTRAGTPR